MRKSALLPLAIVLGTLASSPVRAGGHGMVVMDSIDHIGIRQDNAARVFALRAVEQATLDLEGYRATGREDMQPSTSLAPMVTDALKLGRQPFEGCAPGQASIGSGALTQMGRLEDGWHGVEQVLVRRAGCPVAMRAGVEFRLMHAADNTWRLVVEHYSTHDITADGLEDSAPVDGTQSGVKGTDSQG